MKKNTKRYAAFVLALILVAVSGKFTADHFLKASDGEENIVDEEVYEEYVEEAETVEEVIELPTEEIVAEVVEGEFESEEISVSEAIEEVFVKAPVAEAFVEEAPVEEAFVEEAPVEAVPEAETEEVLAEVIAEEVITEEVEKKVSVFCDVVDDTAFFTSELEGFEDEEVVYQWQVDDGNGWKDIDGASGDTYKITLTDENAGYAYRLFVDVAE